MCYMSKCPYVPPHEWNIDFPHLMLRAKAVKNKKGETRMRDKVLTSTDMCGSLAGIPIVSNVVNATNKSAIGRAALNKTLGVHKDAVLPQYHSDSLRRRQKSKSNNGYYFRYEVKGITISLLNLVGSFFFLFPTDRKCPRKKT